MVMAQMANSAHRVNNMFIEVVSNDPEAEMGKKGEAFSVRTEENDGTG